MCGLLLAGAKNLWKYREAKAAVGNPQVSQSNYLEIFERVKKEVGIKKRIVLLCADEVETVCTMGGK